MKKLVLILKSYNKAPYQINKRMLIDVNRDVIAWDIEGFDVDTIIQGSDGNDYIVIEKNNKKYWLLFGNNIGEDPVFTQEDVTIRVTIRSSVRPKNTLKKVVVKKAVL